MKSKTQVLWSVFSFLEMLLGTAMNAAAFGLIIIPQGFAAGGVTGLSRVISSLSGIQVAAVVFILNMVLLVVGFIFVGKEFVVKTVAVSVIFPIFLGFFSRFPLERLNQDLMMSALVASALLGVGTGLVLRSGASCGGFDVIGVVLNERLGFPVARVMNVCDTTVILLQALGQDILLTAYGILVIALVTVCISWVVTLGTGESQVLIFTEHHDVIRDRLLRELDVGVTMLEAESGYEHRKTQVILSVMPYQKVSDMKRIIMEIDPTAFVVVDQIHSVLGRGYTMEHHFKAYYSHRR